MASYPPQPGHDWQSDGERYAEKDSHAQDSTGHSKRLIWRIFRLGAALALTLAAFILTIIILVVGRHGSASSDLSLITVSTSIIWAHGPVACTDTCHRSI